MAGQNAFALEKLQFQYRIQTNIPMLLYHYAKTIAKAANLKSQCELIGSSLSCLQECLRSCLTARHGKIFVNIKIRFFISFGLVRYTN